MALKKKKTARQAKTKKAKTKRAAVKNPAMRNVTGSTGWISATAVRFVKKKGKPVQVLVKRSTRRKTKKGR